MKIILLSCLVPLFAHAAVERTVTVSGEGEVKIKPDIAFVNLQVQSKGPDAKNAQEKNAREMARVEKILREEFKLEDRELQTTSFWVNPEYRYEQSSGKQIFMGFTVTHGLRAKVRKTEKLGEILDKLSGKGGPEMSVSLQGVSFDTDKRKAYEVQALESAMNNAKERAEALAKFSGRKLKGVLRVSDSQLSAPQPMPRARMMKGEAMMAADVGTSVQAGEIEVRSTVSVEYELD